MQLFKDYIVILAELFSMMILWSALNDEKENKFLKFSIVIITSSLFTLGIQQIYTDAVALVYVLMILEVKFLFKKELAETVLEWCLVTVLTICIQLIMSTLIGLITREYINDSNFFLLGISINLADVAIAVCIYFFAPLKRLYHSVKKILMKTYIFIINIFLYIILLKIIYTKSPELFWNNIGYFLLIQVVFIILCATIMRHSAKIQEQSNIISDYNKYKEILSNLVEDVRRKQHDFKNHLNTIYGILQVSEDECLRKELLQYVSTLNYSLEEADEFIKMDNKVLCAIIFSNRFKAKSRNIKFCYELENACLDFPLKDYEISEILNNLLDNAFEAIGNDRHLNMEVCLRIGIHENRKYIEVKNNGEPISDENIKKIFNRGYTTKKGFDHGYGLYNIKRIVESNKGEILLSFEDNYTIFKLLF
jgi:Signal transduction histidine kinase regulating citrate/malate metabolism